jgi:hypothetical protein
LRRTERTGEPEKSQEILIAADDNRFVAALPDGCLLMVILRGNNRAREENYLACLILVIYRIRCYINARLFVETESKSLPHQIVI